MSNRSAPPAWLCGLVLLALLLLVTPYAGLRHDAVLYLGQLMQRLDPTVLGNDLFFAHGSQDSYSLYSRLLAPLLSLLPLNELQLSLLILGQLATYAALYRLLGLATREPAVRWLGLAFVACLSHRYGGQGIFAFAENFLTARTLTEPLVLWALVLLAEGRRIGALMLLVGAALLHPIMVLPALLLAWFFLLQTDRRYAWALLLAAAFPLLALLGVAPFDALGQRYDSSWWALVKEVNPQVLLQNWSAADWQGASFDLLILLAAWRCLPAPLAGLSAAGLVASATMLLCAFFGADLARNVLLTQLQLWRVLWIAHAMALCLVAPLMALAWRQGGLCRLLAGSMAVVLLAVDAKFSFSWALMLWCALWLGLVIRRQTVSVAMLKLAGMVTVLLALMLCVGRLSDSWLTTYLAIGDAPTRPFLLQALSMPAVALALGVASWLAWRRAAWAAAPTLLLLVGAAGAVADGRSDWTRQVEQGFGKEHVFAKLIPPGAQVYWQEGFAATWVLLRRPSYYDKAQAAGLLFNRGTAQDFEPRWTAWEPLRKHTLACQLSSVLGRHPPSECITPAQADLAQLCRSQSKLDYLIIGRALALRPLASWNPQLASHPKQTFYLYACEQLR